MILYCGVFGEREIREDDIERICLDVGKIDCIWCEGEGKQRLRKKLYFCRACKGTGRMFISVS